jgi:hypothetical protein
MSREISRRRFVSTAAVTVAAAQISLSAPARAATHDQFDRHSQDYAGNKHLARRGWLSSRLRQARSVVSVPSLTLVACSVR